MANNKNQTSPAPEPTGMPKWTKVLVLAILAVCLIAIIVLAIGMATH
jgi:hypothetical protein